MKKKMTMFMLFLLLAGCANAVTAKEIAVPRKERIKVAEVIVLPKIEVLPKEEEIAEPEETVMVQTKQETGNQKAVVSYSQETASSEKPNDTATVSYSEPTPVTVTESESTTNYVPPAPAPEPVKEQGPACPTGVYPDLPCDAVIGDQGYSVTFASEEEANNYGYHMLNDVMYIGEQEITNFAVQPVYVNDHSRVAYYGVELYSNGAFLQ